MSQGVLLVDKATMDVIASYESASEAARAVGVPRSTVTNACRLRKLQRGAAAWRFASDYDRRESFDGKHNRPVALTSADGGTRIVFPNQQAAADFCFVTRACIAMAMKHGTKVIGKYRVSYAR